MMTRVSPILWVLIWTTSSLGMLQASGLQLHLRAQRQSAMGHTGTALVQDASIAFYNPGGLGFLSRRGSLQFGTSVIRPATVYQAQWPNNYQANTEIALLTPVNLYASWNSKADSKWRRFSVGLSINNPFASNIRWPVDWKGRFISQEFSLNTFFVQPTVAFRLNKEVGIGAGIIYGFGNLISRRALSIDGLNGTEGSARFSGTGDGIGANFGLYFRPTSDFSMGLNLRTGLSLDVREGQAQFDVPESFTEQYPNMGFTTQVKLPWVFNIGISIQPEDRFLATIDLDYTGWQVMDTLRLELEQPIRDLDLYPAREFIRSISFRLGGEYILNEKIDLRGGAYYDPSPIRQGLVSPELPDANRIGLTTGIGIQLTRSLSLDLSYVFEFTGERTASFDAARFSGTYETTTSSAGLGLSLAFGKEG